MSISYSGGPQTAIGLVCFDLGGVLIRICRSWEEGCAAAGVDVREPRETSPSHLGRCLESPSLEARLALGRRHQAGLIDCETFARDMSKLLDGLYSPEEVLAVHRAWTHGVYEGVAPLVDRLNAAGIETAALSNTSDSHWRQLLQIPVIQNLTHRAASHLMGLCKPDPAIYRAFEAQVGRNPREILFFDDLSENVAAAREAGWRAEHIDPARCTATQIEAALTRHGVIG